MYSRVKAIVNIDVTISQIVTTCPVPGQISSPSIHPWEAGGVHSRGDPLWSPSPFLRGRPASHGMIHHTLFRPPKKTNNNVELAIKQQAPKIKAVERLTWVCNQPAMLGPILKPTLQVT